VGPSLGRDSDPPGHPGALIGFIALVLSVLVYYKGAGINAVLALLLNLVILLGMMAIFHATLTLRESPHHPDAGYGHRFQRAGVRAHPRGIAGRQDGPRCDRERFSRAFGTIIDTHMTTIISALFLFQFGTGPIKGFAVTLLIGFSHRSSPRSSCRA